MTAGPTERALRFLKSTSVNGGAADDGAGVTDADNAGVVLAGEVAAGAPVLGDEAGGDSSWANETVEIKRAENKATRIVIGWRKNHDELPFQGKPLLVLQRAIPAVIVGPL